MSKQYPRPFTYTIRRGVPLLILSCSGTKADVPADEIVRFIDLYSGPQWLQVKASDFPRENVAALSAQYGYLEPGMAIRTYDREMDEKISAHFCGESNDVWRLARDVKAAGKAFVVGGHLYQAIACAAIRREPELERIITFAEGSFLAQRKQLRLFLEAYAPQLVA